MEHYKVVTVVHAGGERMSMIIDTLSGRPDEHTQIYLINNHRGDAPNTIHRVTESLALALEWGRAHLKDERGLIGRLLAGEIFTAVEMNSLSEFLRTSRQQLKDCGSPMVVCPKTHLIRLIRARDFCVFVMREAFVRIPLSDPRSKVFSERIRQLESAFEEMQPSVPGGQYSIKSLLPEQASELLAILDPESPKNPFPELATRVRNRSIFELMYYTGIRPGELLNLRIQDIDFGHPTTLHIVRRPHPEDDPRKNPAQVKRKSRLLPFSHQKAAAHLKEYLDEVRPGLEAKFGSATAFVFLSIDRGGPLSHRAVQKMFEQLRSMLPHHSNIDGIAPSALTPQCLRHTFSNDTEESLVAQGLSEDERRPILMQLRGDSSSSSVDPYIIRTRERRARTHLMARQNAMFNVDKLGDEDVPY